LLPFSLVLWLRGYGVERIKPNSTANSTANTTTGRATWEFQGLFDRRLLVKWNFRVCLTVGCG